MSWPLIVAIAAAALGLLLAAWVVLRARSALALPLALLSLDQFGWNGATAGLWLTKVEAWRWLGAIAAPMFVPFAFHFVIAFIGQRRRRAGLMFAMYALFGLQGAWAAALAFAAHASIDAWARPLSLVLLVSSSGVALLGSVWVLQHLRTESAATERQRAGLLMVALVLVTLLASTDLLADMGVAVPSLSNLGSAAFNLIMAWLVLRMNLISLDAQTRVFARITSALILVGGGLVVAAAFWWAPERAGPEVLFVGTALLMVMTVARRFTVATVEQHEQLTRVANLGRFSAQMAHDLKNPLAAAQGAIQFLQEEVAQKRSLDPHAEFLQVIAEQLTRVTATVDRYQRLSRVEPHLASVNVNACVESVLALQSFAGRAEIRVERELATHLPPVQADIDLLSTALENLVKNAFEALGDQAGVVRVITAPFEDADGPGVQVSVSDSGPGMNSRTRERAFEPFFTTKASGSGLGLSWVREVVHAHHGEVVLQSHEGQGTRVDLRFRAE